MAHPVGERLHCDECGAEIMFVKECPCPERDQKAHSDICCGQQMRSLGVESTGEPAGVEPRAGQKERAA